MKDFESGRLKPVAYSAQISYDASNGFGVPIRGFATCEYYSRNGSEDGAQYYSVKIDGKSYTDWLSSLTVVK